jgi:hypothetical protein
VFGKDNIKIKDTKYFKIKLYQTYEFYFLDRNKGKEMNRVVCKKLNVQSMMPQGNTNTIIKGKYEIDLNNPICELYNKKLKIYKTKDIYDTVSTKLSKELYVKILSKDLEGIDINMEHYYFEFMKQLVAMNNKNGIDFGIKPYDKYESISALYFIYIINNDVYEKDNSMFTKLMLMKAISHFVYYMNICNICLNISQIAFSCNSFAIQPQLFIFPYFIYLPIPIYSFPQSHRQFQDPSIQGIREEADSRPLFALNQHG